MKKSRLQPLTWNQVSVVSALVCCLMIGSFVGVPWLFADPYDSSNRHTITHESTEAFDANEFQPPYKGAASISTEDPTPIEELSPPARAVVERGIAEYHTEDREYDHMEFDITFCIDAMPVCDEFERPDDFTYTSTSSGDLYDVIETDNGVYVLRTTDGSIGADHGHFSGLEAKNIVFVTMLMPVVAVLAFMTITGHLGITPVNGGTPDQHVILGLAVYGTLLTVVGIVDPFLEMYFGASFSQNLLGPGILLTWGILFAIVAHPFLDT